MTCTILRYRAEFDLFFSNVSMERQVNYVGSYFKIQGKMVQQEIQALQDQKALKVLKVKWVSGCILYINSIGVHLFSTFAKFSETLTFLTP